MKKPIVFIIFNRPDTTAVVFEKIREYEPEKLFVIADGPRLHKAGEEQLCMETRSLIHVDWECEVTKIYSDVNLGCQQRIYTGLNTVFEQVEDAIILEDDCLPHDDFFYYCEELLDYYKENKKIMTIAGNNFQQATFQLNESYYFSSYPECWGWATWKDRWNKIDIKLEKLDELKESAYFKELATDQFVKQYWLNLFERTKSREIDSWGYAWIFTSFYYEGLTVLPAKNLVSNIGYGDNATHTTEYNTLLANVPIHPTDKPLKHAHTIAPNTNADLYTLEKIFNVSQYRETFYIEAKKNHFMKKLLLENTVQFFEGKNVYIFGFGEFGKMLDQILRLKGVQIKGYIVTEKKLSEQSVPNLFETKSLTLTSNCLILSSIEGHHDEQILKELRRHYPNVKTVSWKAF